MKVKPLRAVGALLASLILALGVAGCGKSENQLVGSWILVSVGEEDYDDSEVLLADAMGVSVKLNLSADGKAELDLSGEVVSGGWKSTGDTSGTADLTDFGVVQLRLDGEKLYMEEGEDFFIFLRYEDVSDSSIDIEEAPAPSFEGTWVDADGYATLKLDADGTATFTFGPDVDEGTWEADSETTGVFTGTELGADMTLNGDELTLSLDGESMVFVRQGS